MKTVNIGEYNTLRVVKEVDFGLYLDGYDKGEILIPTKYVLEEWNIDDEIEVFIYKDSEDRLIATSLKPKGIVKEVAVLKAIDVNNTGAFFSWGLEKDLFVPYREQFVKVYEGEYHPVYIFLDEKTERIIGTTKLEKHFEEDLSFIPEEKEKVDIIIFSETELGYKALVNKKRWGLVYKNEVFKPIFLGDEFSAFVKKIREDHKIDLTLSIADGEKINSLEDIIVEELSKNNGELMISDKSAPKVIYDQFGESKKNFKKALGALYKKKKINIFPDKISLTIKENK